MIRLFDIQETEFEHRVGLCSLTDAISCVVEEEINGKYELEMEYPINGSHYSEIILRRIICVKPNQVDQDQAFRIYYISKPIDGIVTIKAAHISYDTSGVIIKPFGDEETEINLETAFEEIKENEIVESNFLLNADSSILKTNILKLKKATNLRNILLGEENSISSLYEGQYKYDNFSINLLNRRGSDRGYTIRYGKNMTDVQNEINSDTLYTGVYPMYSKTQQETKTESEEYYTQVYIVGDVSTPDKKWLSRTQGGKSFIPLLNNSPIQIAQDDIHSDYRGRLFKFNGDEWIETTEQQDPPTLKRIVTKTIDVNYDTDLVNYEAIPGQILTDGIIYIEETSFKNILLLDLTSSMDDDFDDIEDVSEKQKLLYEKAIEYISKNKLGIIRDNITVSFITLSGSSEYARFKDLEKIELGDSVTVIYTKLGVNAKKEVIRVLYNAITEQYDEIELGDISDDFTNSAVTSGDGLSVFENDTGYTDASKVNDILARTVTAEYIQGSQASFTEAMIDQLQTDTFMATVIEANQGLYDTLITELMIADDAEVNNVLKSGQLTVSGDIVSSEIKVGYPAGSLITVYPIEGKAQYSKDWLTIYEGSKIPLVPSKINVYKLYDSDTMYMYDIINEEYIQPTLQNCEVNTGTTTYPVEEYSSAWLKTDDGIINPEFLYIYVLPNTDRYLWNGVKYVKINQYDFDYYIFNVNKEGKVNITDAEININNNFKVDENGNIDILETLKALFIKVDDLTAGNLVVNDIKVLGKLDVQGESTFDSYANFKNDLNCNGIRGMEIGMGGIITGIDTIVNSSLEIYSVSEHKYTNYTEFYVTTVLTTEPDRAVGVDYYLYFNYTLNGVKKTYANYRGGHTFQYDSNIGYYKDSTYIRVPRDWIYNEQSLENNFSVALNNKNVASKNSIRISDYTGGDDIGNCLVTGKTFAPIGYGVIDLGTPEHYFGTLYSGIEYAASDRRLKKDISYSLDEFDNLFDELKPSTYRFKSDKKNRIHLGFIAQDIEKSLDDNNLNSDEYSIVHKGKTYSLSYNEFHALEIYEIQKLKKEIKELKALLEEKEK